MNEMTLANVQRIGVESAYVDIEAFLNEYESEKTKKEYKRDIVEFFQYIHGKELEQLTKEDIVFTTTGVRITKTHAIEYRKHLIKKAKARKPDGNYEGTINRKMSGVRNLYKFLQSVGYDVNYLNFALKSLTYNPESYDFLSKEQVEMIAEFVKGMTYGEELHGLIYMATVTSFRIETLVSLQWKDIKKDQDTRFYTVTVVGKRKQKKTMPIEPWLHEKLVAIKKSSRVFENLTIDNVHDAITRAAKELGIEGRITTHSLRKTAPKYELKTTGNIDAGMKQTGHKSVQTFRDHYVDQTTHYEELAGIKMFQEVKEEVFDLVSKEELLKLLKESNLNAYNQLALKLQEVVGV